AHRAAADVGRRVDDGELRSAPDPEARPGGAALVAAAARSRVQRATSDGAGPARPAESLERAAAVLAAVRADAHRAPDVVADPQVAEWETTTVHQVASALVHAAAVRTESRGGHFRTDFPLPGPAWRRRVTLALDDDATLREVVPALAR